MTTKIAIANDHGGVELKAFLKAQNFSTDIEWIDLGTNSNESVDYPDYGYKLGDFIAEGNADFGIAICGSGIGISIACNRNPDIRAAVCTNSTMARLTRIDNNANILCLGARIVGEILAKDIVETFITTEFEAGGRHERRVNKLKN
ncbi:MAG: ribose 5-phosphate isomerase B [Bdellovibrionales bacterium]